MEKINWAAMLDMAILPVGILFAIVAVAVVVARVNGKK